MLSEAKDLFFVDASDSRSFASLRMTIQVRSAIRSRTSPLLGH
jgi:hypothetical protein